MGRCISLAGVSQSLAPAVAGIRLSLHVLAATIWVGGQFTVAGLLPTVRGLGADAPRAVARALARLLWPAYAILVATGFWSVAAIPSVSETMAWKVVLGVKIGVVALAGIATWLHGRSRTPGAVAVWGAIGGISSVAALVIGVFLAG